MLMMFYDIAHNCGTFGCNYFRMLVPNDAGEASQIADDQFRVVG